MSRFAIALPVFNGAGYLREALDSVLAQEFGDFELVVSDNCSTDETPSILSEYYRRDRRIRVSRSEQLLPQARNVNRAVDLCDSTWVKLLCHDDLLLPACMGTLAAAVQSADERVGLVGHAEEWLFSNGFRFRFPGGGSLEPRQWEGPVFVRQMLLGRAPAPVPSLTTAMVRKAAWHAARGFDERFAHFDIFLWAKLLVTWNYRYVQTVLTTNRIHGAQVATAARKSQRSIQDQSIFWREFVREHGQDLSLGWSAHAAARLKAISAAGTHMAIELIQGRHAMAWEMARRLPLGYLPILPVFLLRSLRAERRKLRQILPHVPAQAVYPG